MGLTALQVSSFNEAYEAFVSALTIAQAPATRTKASVLTKSQMADSLRALLRQLGNLIEAQPQVTDAQKIDLGLNVRKHPTPIGVPVEAPNLDVHGRWGTVVQVKLHDGTGSRRGKPAGVSGAALFSYVGEQPPAETSEWAFEGNTTKTLLDVVFDADLPPGTKVWFTAMWFSPRMQSGPGCAPVSTVLAGGAMPKAA